MAPALRGRRRYNPSMVLPYPLALLQRLSLASDSRILLVVLDGIGDVPVDGETPLSAADTPNLDALSREASLGLSTVVAPGITPGSGPGHLSLFGYDPLVYDVGRGVLSALGIDLDLGGEEVAARGNFATFDNDGLVTDRRAGRISTALNEELITALKAEISEVEGVAVELHTESEYRFVVRLRGEGLGGEVGDTDPGRVGLARRAAKAQSGDQSDSRTASVLERLSELCAEVLSDVPVAREAEPAVNGVLLRGIGRRPELPRMGDICRLRAGSIAAYPMYRGVSRLVGMECPPIDLEGTGERTAAKLASYRAHGRDYEFLYFHVKKTDSYGEDGDFAKKTEQVADFDAILPQLLDAEPDVVVITGDHSTPVLLRAHSWHPLPVLLWSRLARRDGRCFTEMDCRGGSLGTLRHLDLLPLAMANAGKLAKLGA